MAGLDLRGRPFLNDPTRKLLKKRCLSLPTDDFSLRYCAFQSRQTLTVPVKESWPNMHSLALVLTLVVVEIAACPWVPDVAGVDSALLKRSSLEKRQAFGGAVRCACSGADT